MNIATNWATLTSSRGVLSNFIKYPSKCNYCCQLARPAQTRLLIGFRVNDAYMNDILCALFCQHVGLPLGPHTVRSRTLYSSNNPAHLWCIAKVYWSGRRYIHIERPALRLLGTEDKAPVLHKEIPEARMTLRINMPSWSAS